MEKYTGYTYKQEKPNTLPPVYAGIDIYEVQTFNITYGKDYRQAVRGVRSFAKSK